MVKITQVAHNDQNGTHVMIHLKTTVDMFDFFPYFLMPPQYWCTLHQHFVPKKTAHINNLGAFYDSS